MFTLILNSVIIILIKKHLTKKVVIHMETIVKTATLKAAFMKLTKFQSISKGSMEYVQVQVEADAVTLVASTSNSDTLSAHVTVKVPATTYSNGTTFFPFTKMHNLIKKTKDKEMTITKDTVSNTKASLTRGWSDDSSLPFYICPRQEEKLVTMPKANFKKALTKVLYAASTGDSRPVLACINFAFKGDEMTFTSTDSHRLAQYKTAITSDALVRDVSVHSKLLSKLISVFEKEDTLLTIGLPMSDSYTSYAFDDMTVILSSNQTSNYPDVSRLLDVTPLTEFSMQTTDLYDAVDMARATTVLDENEKIMLTVDSFKFKVQASDGQTNFESAVDVQDYYGDAQGLKCNASFLLDALKALDGTVKVCLQEHLKPLLFTNHCDDGKESHLILPIR